MPQHPVVRDLRIRDLGVEPRLHPNGGGLPERLRQRHCVARKRLKGASNIPRGVAIPTGADPADINQSVFLATCEAKLEQPCGALRHEPDHGEPFPFPALRRLARAKQK